MNQTGILWKEVKTLLKSLGDDISAGSGSRARARARTASLSISEDFLDTLIMKSKQNVCFVY